MKRGTPEHPKTKDLCSRLRLPLWGGVGILESIWLFAQKFAVQGDIGKFSNEAIAEAIGWKKDSSTLIRALVASRWLDECSCHRLYIHDWKDHADQTVQRVVAKRKLALIGRHASIVLAPSYDDPSKCYDNASQPLPLPLPLPLPPALPDFRNAIDAIYARHPKKQGRILYEQALSELLSVNPDPAGLIAKIDESHLIWCDTNDWRKNGGQFAPKLSNWIRDGGYLDWPPDYDPEYEARIERERQEDYARVAKARQE